MPPTKKYENPWVGFELTPSGDMLNLNAMTTTQRGPVIKQYFTNKPHSNSARSSDRKKIRGYPSEPSLHTPLSSFVLSLCQTKKKELRY